MEINFYIIHHQMIAGLLRRADARGSAHVIYRIWRISL